MPRTRRTLIAWTLANFVLAVVAAAYPGATIFTLFYVGAAYAVAFGALHVASGVWIRRIAVPYLEPTIQSQWTARRSTGKQHTAQDHPSHGHA
jgi:hypothetical protein